ncbi:unnamed protein product [Chrysodeixis includens]|uniref:Uncharacterized protein n=1 Tax=Chrysodeixis includens TaxID=689277 RepID=A0A9N8KWR4_CHRIL|nr:unnamed protein product [Chrysodeixis includens]
MILLRDPTPTESDLLPEKWLPTTEKEENYFDIGSATLQPGGPFEKDVAFWDMFYHDRAKDYHGINLHDI